MPPVVDQSFDYLAMLGLGPADLERLWLPDLREIIKKKRKEWTAQAINPLYQQQARANLERVKQFEQLLSAPEAFQAYVSYLREVHAAQRGEQERDIAEIITDAIGGQKRTLTAAQRELLTREADELGIPPAAVESVIARLGLRIVAGDGDGEGPKLPYRQPALDRALLQQITRSLKVLGKKSFYELLDLPAGTTPARIGAAARLQYEKWSKSLPKTAVCVAWEKSLQACLTYLKDAEAKQKYDRGLFNARMDDFLRRVDLALAAGRLTREMHVQLARSGVQEFGLTSQEVTQCILVRGAARGVPVTRPVQLSVQLEGQIRCARCSGWNPARFRTCTHCASSLVLMCRNPACGQALSPGSKVCEHCQLPVARGGQYAELLKLCDLLLDSGVTRPAMEACRLAAQVLPGPACETRTARAGKIRVLLAQIREAAAAGRWLQTQSLLERLVPLAPRCTQPGIPELEEVGTQLEEWRRVAAEATTAPFPPEQAAQFAALLARWTDSPDFTARGFQLCADLEASGRLQEAWRIASALEATPAAQETARPLAARLQEARLLKEEQEGRLREARADWHRAIAEQRGYAAERAWSALQELHDETIPSDAGTRLQDDLLKVRAEVQDLLQAQAAGKEHDVLIAGHLAILQRCRDCRESLSALRQLSPDLPVPPVTVTVTLQGNRRLVQWQLPETGKRPQEFVVQRAWVRPGSRFAEAAFVTVTTTSSMSFVDEDVAHSGDLLRYAVSSQIRGTLDVVGHAVREYAVAAPPVAAEPLLIWHEALGLRSQVLAGMVELRWHTPAGAREILLERWPGFREDLPLQPERIPLASTALFRDPLAPVEKPYTYRLRCVYDAPQGEFITPGICLTVTPPARITDSVVQASALSTPALETAAIADNGPPAAEVQQGLVNGTGTPAVPVPTPVQETVLPPAASGTAATLPVAAEQAATREVPDLAGILERAPFHATPPTAAPAVAAETESSPEPPQRSEPDEDHRNPLKRFGLWPPRELKSPL